MDRIRQFNCLWLLLLLPASVSAQIVEIDNDIDEDTVWSRSFADVYVVTFPILVDTAVTLTIEPGVVIKFESDAGITIYGTLDAQGADAVDGWIRFTSLLDDNIAGDSNGDGPSVPGVGDWAGVTFDGAGS
ncbi:MAG: hypothetical protein ABIF77_07465, partial [bacterium]